MKAMVCPDIMNVIRERKTTNLETEFQPFARKYNTYQIKHWSGMTLSYNSSQLKSGCSFIKGAVLSPNCIEVCASKISIRVTVNLLQICSTTIILILLIGIDGNIDSFDGRM